MTPFKPELSAHDAFILNPLDIFPFVEIADVVLEDTEKRSFGRVINGVKALASGSLWILLAFGCSDGGECDAELVPALDELDISLDVGEIRGIPFPFMLFIRWLLTVDVVEVVPNRDTNVELRLSFKLSDHRALVDVGSNVGDPIPSSLSYIFGKPFQLPKPFNCPTSESLDVPLIGGKLNTVDSVPCESRLFPLIALLYAVKLEVPLGDLLYMEFKKSLVPFSS